jgi:serine protease Do
MGIQISDLNEDVANYLHMTKIEGVFIADVPTGGAAWKSGIKDHDVILQIDAQKINSRSELVERLAQYQPGETVLVQIWRNNKILRYPVKLESDNQQYILFHNIIHNYSK